MTEQVTSDASDTPKTDALPQPYYNRADAIYELSRDNLVTWQNHARAQERRIAELETRLRYRVAVCNCSGHSKCGACQDDEVALL